MRLQSAQPDEVVAAIASRQRGVITFDQLLDAGLSPGGVQRRVASGRLHRVYRGLYAVGHTALSNEGRWLAAVLACGEGAVLSHRSAAEHLGLLEVGVGPIDVSTPGRAGRLKRAGLRIHRPSSLPRSDVIERDGIAVTTPARTIADLKRTASREVVAQAQKAASFKGWELGSEEEGFGAGGKLRTRSELETRFMRLCSRRHLQRPEVNVRLGPYTVDFLWPASRLVVETDGWRGHRGRQAFEDDRTRDAWLRARGYEVLRFSWRQVVDEPAAVVAVLRRYLE
jgi:very-short-patch-repair endonuclease